MGSTPAMTMSFSWKMASPVIALRQPPTIEEGSPSVVAIDDLAKA